MFKYYIQNAVGIFVFMLVCSLLSMAITMIGISWLQLVLSIITACFFFMGAYILGLKCGQDAQKQKNSNKNALKAMLETGKEVKINKIGEYKWYNGLVIGLISCSVFVLLILIQLIITLSGSDSFALGGVVKIVFAVFTAPQNAIDKAISLYYSLIYVVATVGIVCLGYYIGKKKVDYEQAHIQRLHNRIHGKGE